ncbi:hypothetical protein [Streptomyces sp. NRRL WC-3618]|uniref:hypothetical protein n=1 Tax=Streptomyces sp. NRRL WC-3618 TaxID=1519490 RepID=UPI000AF9BBDF|nr:hypothetical protein [Streptomyces sp. NRRL WC-3618]
MSGHVLDVRPTMKTTTDGVRDVLPTGADHVFECVGRVELVRQAVDSALPAPWTTAAGTRRPTGVSECPAPP